MSNLTPSSLSFQASLSFQGLKLRAENLAADAGPLRLFEGLSFTLNGGDVLILRGPNGSGKTTLLKAIAALYPLASGVIDFQGKNPYNIAENCYFLGHKNGLKEVQTVKQNLEFFADFEGVSKEVITPAVQRLHLTSLLDLPVNLLSAGQARRTAFARLLIKPRPIWLLDEPTSALDDKAAQTLDVLCQAHLKKGGILLVSTHLPFLSGHNNAQALDMADFTAYMS